MRLFDVLPSPPSTPVFNLTNLDPTSTDIFVEGTIETEACLPLEPRLLSLPPEIIQHILSYLSPQHLVSVHRTCRYLLSQTLAEKLWIDLIRRNFTSREDLPTTPSPFSSWRALFLAYHPYWFIPRHKIWFSDEAYTGKMIIATYNPELGTIEGCRLTAERPSIIPEVWSYKPDVLIHHLDPRVYISNDDQVLSLSCSTRNGWQPSQEIPMRVGAPTQKIDASLLLSLNLPEPTASAKSVAVWPPRTIPSMPRTRTSSSSSAADRFSSIKHKPHTLSEISNTTFRIRTWSHFTQGMHRLGVRLGEEISTWSTLSPELYTPTPTKPYQGIFVGDYAAHGCEFLLVLQSETPPTQRQRHWSRSSSTRERPSLYLRAILAALTDGAPADSDETDELISSLMGDKDVNANVTSHQAPITPNVADPDGVIHQGAIEAIKLTGDVNIPRGEHTFIADDIGPAGTIRIASERPFTGARVIKSRGHVAGRGFQDDEFIPSQLFLINTDLLAQYWLPLGHISYYKRLNIDELPRRSAMESRGGF